MAETLRRKKLELKSGIELAPMVDVVFLLVTYFLINSTLARNPAIKIELPKSLTAQAEQQRTVVIYVDRNNQIYLNDKRIDLALLPGTLRSQIQDVQKDQVIIRGDKDASYQAIVTVMDYVNQAGIANFSLATEK